MNAFKWSQAYFRSEDRGLHELKGLDEPVKPRLAPDIQDLGQVKPKRLRDEQERGNEQSELEPGIGSVHGGPLQNFSGYTTAAAR